MSLDSLHLSPHSLSQVYFSDDGIRYKHRQPVEGLLHTMRRIALYQLRAILMLVALQGLILLIFAAGVTLSSLTAHVHDCVPAVP